MTTRTAPVILHGIPAAAGRAAGPLFIVHDAPSGAEVAQTDLHAAVARVAGHLESQATALASKHATSADILRAQAAMVRDPVLISAIDQAQQRGSSLPQAIRSAVEGYAAQLEALDDAYLRERAADVREVGRLLAAEVTGVRASRITGLTEPSIVLAHELSPADTLAVESALLLGIVTELGGPTCHAAIVARELGIPAIVGATGALPAAAGFGYAQMDGATGEVTFLDELEAHEGVTVQRATVADTRRSPVPILANISSVESAATAVRHGARGVGLFRTEFMFMAERGPMSEDEQFEIYRGACAVMAPHPVVVRTLDAGADKPLPYLTVAQEPNPQLGKRGVRLWLAHADLYRPQVRALLRTFAEHANLRVMLPMVAARAEMIAARQLFANEARALGVPLPPLGMMVEIPAVAAALGAFAGVADFISLGTNDLTQYSVAADRELDWSEDLTEMNPGVLRLMADAIRTAKRLDIPAGVCGELAGRPTGAVFLAGADADSLSMTADAIAGVFDVLTSVGLERCRRAAQRALAATNAADAERELRLALGVG